MKFIKCSISNLKNHKYNPGSHSPNNDVNLDHVITFKKGRLNYYPDNEGIPIIQFTTPNGVITWMYSFYEEYMRDEDYKIVEKEAHK